jgi:hypothetical protein
VEWYWKVTCNILFFNLLELALQVMIFTVYIRTLYE